MESNLLQRYFYKQLTCICEIDKNKHYKHNESKQPYLNELHSTAIPQPYVTITSKPYPTITSNHPKWLVGWLDYKVTIINTILRQLQLVTSISIQIQSQTNITIEESKNCIYLFRQPLIVKLITFDNMVKSGVKQKRM